MVTAIKKVPHRDIVRAAVVKRTTAGNIVEYESMQRKPQPIGVKRISAEEYMILETGEIRKYAMSEDKSEVSFTSIRRTLAKIRGLLNANCTDERNLLWVTLTYAENMMDSKRLYSDFERFWKHFKRRCVLEKWDIPEYISVIEPQARGAWHCHVMMIFPRVAPYIDNNTVIAPLWGQGFTKTKAVHGVDNIGAYFSAYLADLPVDEMVEIPQGADICEKEISDDGKKQSKKFIKGGRLCLYPSGLNWYRTSRGVKRPFEEDLTDLSDDEIKKEKASSGKLTFSSTLEIYSYDDNIGSGKPVNTITKEYYNIRRKKNQ